MSHHPTNLPTQNEKLLTYDEAGKVLGVSHRTIWELVNQGGLPKVKFGGSVRIDPADLRAFIASSKVTQPGQGKGGAP